MKTPFPNLILIVSLASMLTNAQAGVVTLTAHSENGTNGQAELSIGQYEIAELISYPTYMNRYGSRIDVIKDGKTAMHVVGENGSLQGFDPLVVAGPAILRLSAFNNRGTTLCTIRVSPEPFPPDRTILVPPGTNQARITLECSTNLVQWFAATNGVYGPLPEAKFFRIKLEALP